MLFSLNSSMIDFRTEPEKTTSSARTISFKLDDSSLSDIFLICFFTESLLFGFFLDTSSFFLSSLVQSRNIICLSSISR